VPANRYFHLDAPNCVQSLLAACQTGTNACTQGFPLQPSTLTLARGRGKKWDSQSAFISRRSVPHFPPPASLVIPNIIHSENTVRSWERLVVGNSDHYHTMSTEVNQGSMLGRGHFSRGRWYCECDQVARCLTTKKSGPNKGRKCMLSLLYLLT